MPPLITLDRIVSIEPGKGAKALRNVPTTLAIFSCVPPIENRDCPSVGDELRSKSRANDAGAKAGDVPREAHHTMGLVTP